MDTPILAGKNRDGELWLTPHVAYFDEATKTLMCIIVINGHEIKTPLIVANKEFQGNIYTEETLRTAAVKYNEDKKKKVDDPVV